MAGQIIVLNYRTQRIAVGDLDIMYSHGATLGNPFYKMARTRAGRYQSLRKFRRYLYDKVRQKGAIQSEIKRLAQKYNQGETIRLYCCCKPEPCHGDIVADCIRWMAKLITPKPHDPRAFDCKKCGHTGVPNLIESGPHTKLVCQKCSAYIKFASAAELKAITGIK